MKILRTPEQPPLDRTRWILEFQKWCRDDETPHESGANTSGNTIALEFPSGYVIEWNWIRTHPRDAAAQAREAGAIGSMKTP